MDREVSCLVTAPSPDAHHGPIRGNPDVSGREGRFVEDCLMRADVWPVNTSQATTGFRFDVRSLQSQGNLRRGGPPDGVMTELLPSWIGIFGSHVPRLTRCTSNLSSGGTERGRTLETFDL